MASLLPAHRHPTLFLHDFRDHHNAPVRLTKFMLNEIDYDVSMVAAFGVMLKTAKVMHIAHEKRFLSLMDTIQSVATDHIESSDRFLPGRVNGPNSFHLTSIHTSNSEGIKDLIRTIWIKKEDFILYVKPQDDISYQLTPRSFTLSLAPFKTFKTLIASTGDPTIDKTHLAMLDRYFVGLYENSMESQRGNFKLYSCNSPKNREVRSLHLIRDYFETLDKKTTDVEKIECISLLMRDLLQQHLYYDGNGRTIYLLANFLMIQNNLAPFYPVNMCIFDANSLDRMVGEVIEGQKRFVEFFGDFNTLSEKLKAYDQKLDELCSLLREQSLYELFEAYDRRDFTEIFKVSASDERYFDLFKFMLRNIRHFNTEYSREYNTDTARVIARSNQNFDLLDYLQTD